MNEAKRAKEKLHEYYVDEVKRVYPELNDDMTLFNFKRYNGMSFQTVMNQLISKYERLVIRSEKISDEDILSRLDNDQLTLLQKLGGIDRIDKYIEDVYYPLYMSYLKFSISRSIIDAFGDDYGVSVYFENPIEEFKKLDRLLSWLDQHQIITFTAQHKIYYYLLDTYPEYKSYKHLRELLSAYPYYLRRIKEEYNVKWKDGVAACMGLTPVKILGKGTFATTYMVKGKENERIGNQENEPTYALKISASPNMVEIDATSRLIHPNLVRSYGLYIDCEIVKGKKGLLLELCDQTLTEALDQKEALDRYHIAYEISSAVWYLHENGILHLDIKSDNVMLCGRKAKLIDLGSSIYSDDVETGIYQSGSRTSAFYRPPEHFRTRGYIQNDKVDVWSLGITLLELFSGDRFESGLSIIEDNGGFIYDTKFFQEFEDVVEYIHGDLLTKSRRKEYIESMVEDKEVIDLLFHMLDPEVLDRYSMDDVINHPLFYDEPFIRGREVRIRPKSMYPNNRHVYKMILRTLKLHFNQAPISVFFQICDLYNRISYAMDLPTLEIAKHVVACIVIILNINNIAYSDTPLISDIFVVDEKKQDTGYLWWKQEFPSEYSIIVLNPGIELEETYPNRYYADESYLYKVVQLADGILLSNRLYKKARTLDELRAAYKYILMSDVNQEQVDIGAFYDQLSTKIEDSGESKRVSILEF